MPVTIPGYVPQPEPVSVRSRPGRRPSSTSSPARCPRTSRTGSTRAPATTRSPRRSSPAGRRPCRRSRSSSTASRPTATGRRPARTRRPRSCAWAGSPTTRRSTTSSTCSPTEGGKYGCYSCYSNPQVDKLFKQARSTIDADAAPRTSTTRRRTLILTDAPSVPIYTYRDARVDQQPHRRLQLQLVRSRRHVERLGQSRRTDGRLPS